MIEVYSDAGRREGLDVRGAYVHDLKSGVRAPIDIHEPAIGSAESAVQAAAVRLRVRDYQVNPGTRCRTCEVRTVCKVGPAF